VLTMKYELIIIGAGPGGATAAKTAAEKGANVLLLEAAEEGRYKCCAGGIPVSNEDFSEIPHGVGDREITGGFVVTPSSGPMEFEATGEKNKGYCMFRTDFDKFLVDLARDAGAQVMYGFRARDIVITGKGDALVKGPQEYRGKCVILSTGLGGGQIQHRLGLEVPPMINGIQAEVALPESAIDKHFGNRVWEFFDRSLSAHGIAWAFPKREAVSLGVLGKGVKIDHLKAFLKYPIIKDKIEGRELMTFGGRKIWAAPIPDKMISKPYRDQVMVIGDACGTADPILYEGIYQARLSGKIAANIFCQALEEDDFSEFYLSKYNELLLKHLYEENLRYTYKFHHLLYHSGLVENIIDATFSLTQDDPEMMQSMIALFTGSQTRKKIWETMMSRKFKLVKKLGLRKSLRLFPTLLRAARI